RSDTGDRSRHSHCCLMIVRSPPSRWTVLALNSPSDAMHYAEATRRINLLAGLGLGSVLGASLGMLLAPQKGVRVRWSRRRSGTARLRAPLRAMDDLRTSVRGLVNGS